MRTYDVLLLDFGGVCLFNPVEMHDHLEDTLGLPRGTFTWKGPLAPETDELWSEMVQGRGLSERGYWHQRAADVGAAAARTMTLHEYMNLLYVPPRESMLRPESLDVTKRALAAGYGVSVLTNDLRAFHGDDWAVHVPLLQIIDHLVDCSDTGILKPDKRAYDRAAEIVGVPAERMLFVDDQPLNVAGAKDAGMGSFWFDVANATDSWHQVAQLLGL